MFYLIAAAGLILGISGPAMAQDQPVAPPPQEKKFEPRVSEQLKQGQASYEDAVKKLTLQQQGELVELDKRFYASMHPVIDTYDMGGKLIFCLRRNSAMANNQQEFVNAFHAYRAERLGEQQKIWKEHRQIAVKIDYLDHSLLDAHYAYVQTVQTSVVEQMVDQAGSTGGYNGTNCQDVQNSLKGAASRAANRPRQPYEGTFDEQGGVSGTPAK